MPWVRVADLEALPPWGGARFEVEGLEEPVAIFRIGEELYALGDTCSHEEASLSEGEVDGEQKVVSCPRHDAHFDLRTGRPLTLPAVVPVPTYPVKVEDGAVWIEIP